MIEVTKETTLQDFIENGGDISEYLPKNVAKGGLVINAKNTDIVIATDAVEKTSVELNIEDCTLTVVKDASEATDIVVEVIARRERVWERMFKEQEERHNAWNKKNK